MKTTIDNTQTTYGKYSLIYAEEGMEIKDTATVVSLDFSCLLEVRHSACFALLVITVRCVYFLVCVFVTSLPQSLFSSKELSSKETSLRKKVSAFQQETNLNEV